MLFAQQAERPLIEFTLAPIFEDHGIALAVMGIVVVFIALVLVATFIKILPRILPAPPVAGTQQPQGLLPVEDDQLSEELVAVIAAAVAATVVQPHRIVRIRGLTPEDLGWSLKGRFQHHHSHQLAKRKSR